MRKYRLHCVRPCDWIDGAGGGLCLRDGADDGSVPLKAADADGGEMRSPCVVCVSYAGQLVAGVYV